MSLFPFIANAQISTVTEAQKQQALQTVSKFCTLFTQWANGQRTLDTQIYALCSGTDCSAYDDVSTNKETTLRNYLLGIQKKYPKSLAMEISQPSLSDISIHYEPEQLSMTQQYGQTISGNALSVGLIPHYSISTYANAYIVFDVRQIIPSLSKKIDKKIIYDVKSQKITAFITGSGTFVSFVEAFDLVTKNEYKEAIAKFEYAASNNRASFKALCYKWAAVLSGYIIDFENGLRFAKLSGEKWYEYSYLAMIAITQNSFQESISYLHQLENYAQTSNQYKNELGYIYETLGHLYANSSINQVDKAVDYFKRAFNENIFSAGYNLWLLSAHTDISSKVTIEEAIDYLFWSAEKGYPPSFLIVYLLYEDTEDVHEKESAQLWLKASADSGDTFGMAYYGKFLIEHGDVANGKEWLKKSLEGNSLELQINVYSGIIDWPLSRADIQKLLNEVQGNNSATSSTTASTHTNNNVSSSSTTTPSNSYNHITNNNYTSSSNNNYKFRHRKFNQAQDNFFGGVSVGYIQKQWTIEENGEKEKCGLFDDDKYLQGIQAGFRIDPQFGGGLGINTGLFYEYCWAKSDDMNNSYGTYHYTYEEHGLYLPLHLKFTMNFNKWFQLSLYGGAGFNYVLSGNAYLRSDGDTYDSENVFSEEEDWKKFNMMLEYGISIRIKAVQIDFTQSHGLNNWSDTDGVKMKQGRPLSISVTYCF